MKKIKPIKIDKIWGYELWLHSPLIKNQSLCEDGNKIFEGPLVKIIKTNQPLSIQVHPDKKLAKELELENNGKSEAWYILEANPNSECIVGIKTFDKKIIRQKLKDKTFEELLITIKVKPGDYINVLAGLVHGIGSNIKLLEIQEPSDITYRFFDYNRLENGKQRELHIEKSLKSIKDHNYKLDLINNEYKLKNYAISFYKNQKIILKSKAVIVDIPNQIAYLAKKNEIINFSHYAIIYF